RVLHAERREHALLDALGPWRPRGALDDVSRQRRGVVRVRRELAGRPDARGDVPREPGAERDDPARVARPEVARVLLEPGRVGHHVPQRDRLRERPRDLEVEVAVHVGLERDLTLLDELEDRGPGEELADRADAEERLLPVDRGALLEVGVAVALGEEDL